ADTDYDRGVVEAKHLRGDLDAVAVGAALVGIHYWHVGHAGTSSSRAAWWPASIRLRKAGIDRGRPTVRPATGRPPRTKTASKSRAAGSPSIRTESPRCGWPTDWMRTPCWSLQKLGSGGTPA